MNTDDRVIYLLTIMVDGQMHQCEINATSDTMAAIYSAIPESFKIRLPHCGLRSSTDGAQFHQVEYAR